MLNYIMDNSVLLLSLGYCVFLAIGWSNISFLSVLGIGMIILSVGSFVSKSNRSYRVPIIVLLVSLGLAVINVSRFISQEKKLILEVEEYADTEVVYRGVIVEEPKYSHESVRLILKGTVVSSNDYPGTMRFKIITRAARFPRKKVGEVCEIKGLLEQPENFDEFDYVEYLRNKQVYYELNYAEVDCSGLGREGNQVRNLLYDLKMAVVLEIQRRLPEPQAGLLIGILIGENRIFEDSFEESLRISGTTHIIAASGYNITLIVLMVNKVAFFLKKRLRLLISIICIWAFCLLSGFSASIVRAGIMSTISIIGLLFGYKGEIHSILPLTAFVYALINVRIFFDVGFQLSLAATAGLVYLSPIVEMAVEPLKQIPGLIGSFWTLVFSTEVVSTISCTISTLPISVLTFGQFSIISVICNMLVLPVLEDTMFIGVIAFLITIVWGTLGEFMYLVVWAQLKYFELVVRFFGDIDLVSFDMTGEWSRILINILIGLIAILTVSFYAEGEDGYYQGLFEKQFGIAG
ncbi:DUF4131 domain-containing protein [Candidatus Dojkabacteria bacterium]|nr:DUF4131 domain-containing protein [Candidatus Dojkabacteria bacterium]